jgi:hypothetical protein
MQASVVMNSNTTNSEVSLSGTLTKLAFRISISNMLLQEGAEHRGIVVKALGYEQH